MNGGIINQLDRVINSTKTCMMYILFDKHLDLNKVSKYLSLLQLEGIGKRNIIRESDELSYLSMDVSHWGKSKYRHN